LTRTLGVIGGIAPGSTVDYYRLLIDRYRELQPDGSYPTLIINSVVLGGTELPLLFRDAERPSIPLLDATRIHVESALARLLSK
jgi:aspartate/glutamate racemase